LVETIGFVNRYITNVFTVGEDADGGPIAQKRNINWYVYDEGGEDEAAYYGDRNWKNPESKNITGSNLTAIEAIYRNQELRTRATGGNMQRHSYKRRRSGYRLGGEQRWGTRPIYELDSVERHYSG
jgi:hypothetical protein